jgi:fructose-1,6-bisphosphatase/inositol monophosphatase family enzyme
LRFVSEMRVALYACGQVALALQGNVPADTKPPDSPHQQSTAVSVVDHLCQEILLLRAYDLAPDIEIYSEEMAVLPDTLRELFAGNRHRYVIVIDPVDGTDDYLSGGVYYGHVLGLLDQETGRMVCGMVYFPRVGSLYAAVEGMGAFVSRGLMGRFEPLRPARPPRTVSETKRLEDPHRQVLEQAGFAIVPEESHSAAWELLRVARGEVGVAVMPHFHGHDTAMIAAIIGELGGAALDASGEPVRYDRDMPRLPLVVQSLSPDYARAACEALIKVEEKDSDER